MSRILASRLTSFGQHTIGGDGLYSHSLDRQSTVGRSLGGCVVVAVAQRLDWSDNAIRCSLGRFCHADRDCQSQWHHDDFALYALDGARG